MSVERGYAVANGVTDKDDESFCTVKSESANNKEREYSDIKEGDNSCKSA